MGVAAMSSNTLFSVPLFAQYLDWIEHDVAFQCGVCAAVLVARPASVALVKLIEIWSRKDESTLELQQTGSH